MTEIKLIPDIPSKIIDASEDNNLVIFIGAGLSRLVGSVSWDELANKVFDEIVELGVISFADVEQLSTLDSKKKLSIAMNIHPEIRQTIDFRKIIKAKDKLSDVYDHVANIGCMYVTTNYDDYLYDNTGIEEGFESISDFKKQRVYTSKSKFEINQLEHKKTIFHIHGSLDNPSEMVLTTADYLKLYTDEAFKAFLTELFNKKTVFFIGYGLEELEILEFMLRHKKTQQQHFLLQGYYSHQNRTFDHLNEYYSNTFNVEIIPFLMDKKKHKQQIDILEKWSSEIKIGDTKISDTFEWVMEAADE